MNSYFIFANVAKNIHPAKTYSIIYYFIGFTVRIRHEMFLKVTVLLLHLSCVFQHPIREKYYCCPLKLKMAKTSNPKPCKFGLRAYSFKK